MSAWTPQTTTLRQIWKRNVWRWNASKARHDRPDGHRGSKTRASLPGSIPYSLQRNNAEEIAAAILAQNRKRGAPSHYDLLLITGVMASSPLLQPGTDVVRVTHGRHDTQRDAYERARHLCNQFLTRVGFGAERTRVVTVKAGCMTGPMRLMPISA